MPDPPSPSMRVAPHAVVHQDGGLRDRRRHLEQVLPMSPSRPSAAGDAPHHPHLCPAFAQVRDYWWAQQGSNRRSERAAPSALLDI